MDEPKFVKIVFRSKGFRKKKSLKITASESSIGSSGGMTLVRMRMHSRNNLYRERDSSSVPKNGVKKFKFFEIQHTFDPKVSRCSDGENE